MICYWWLKKDLEAEYVMQYIDMLNKMINIWKTMIRTSYHHTLRIQMQTICKKKIVNGFKWVKKLSSFDERFIKDYDELWWKQ